MARTLNQTSRGEMDVKVCNALVYGCSVQLRAIEGGDLVERIKRLEEAEAARRQYAGSNGRVP